MQPKNMDLAKKWLEESDFVLIGAGAGISVDAKNDYLDKKAFKERFPAIYPYQFIGKRDWSPELQWGYMFKFVDTIWKLPKHHVYTDLLKSVEKKDYFVITSNVDGFFPKNGFDLKKYFTPQGDFQYMQCLSNCQNKVWSSKKIVEDAQKFINMDTQEIPKSQIPKCKYCGGKCFYNVRGGSWFTEVEYKDQEKRYHDWVGKTKKDDKKLLIIEFGCGFNTPSVIRWRMEKLAYVHPNAKFIRINPEHFEISKEISNKSLSLKMTALEFVEKL